MSDGGHGEENERWGGGAGADPSTEFSPASNSGCYERSRSGESGVKMRLRHRVESLMEMVGAVLGQF
jgi:hypothetical protein